MLVGGETAGGSSLLEQQKQLWLIDNLDSIEQY
jgi:hypothetical protein